MKTKALTSAAVAGILRPMLQDINVGVGADRRRKSAASWSRRSPARLRATTKA